MLIHFSRSKLTTHSSLKKYKKLKDTKYQDCQNSSQNLPKSFEVKQTKKILARNTGILLFLARKLKIINHRFEIYSTIKTLSIFN